MENGTQHTDPRHPIGVVSARTGIAQDVLRAWERRYQAVTPGRTGTGRRLYSDEDIERLSLLKRVVAAGRRISDVAGLTLAELQQLAAEDRAAGTVPRRRGGAPPNGYLSGCLDALERLDRVGFEEVLAQAAVELSNPMLRQKVLVPVMRAVGERWQQGTIRIAHEHLASAIVRSFLASRNGRHRSGTAPRIILTTPAGQYHELGALMAAAAAEEVGWDIIYLGPNLPAEEIAAAASKTDARAVALSIVYRPDDRHLFAELRALRSYVGDLPVFVGGRAAVPIGPALAELDMRGIEDLAGFQLELGKIQR